MHNINFDTEYSLVIHFRQGGGGHFLSSLLGLSDDVYLQNNELAMQQLNGNMSSQQKLDMMVNSIKDVTDAWTDFGVSHDKLFGFKDWEVGILLPALKRDPTVWRFHQDIEPLSHTSKYLVHISHPGTQLFNRLEVWPNSKLIVLTDTREFIKAIGRQYYIERTPYVRDQCIKYWNTIRGPSWPIEPPREIEDIAKLPDFVQDELYNVFNGEIERYVTSWNLEEYELQLIKDTVKQDTFYVSAMDFMDADKILETTKHLYSWLGLKDYKAEMCEQLLSAWYNKLLETAPIQRFDGIKDHRYEQ